MAEDFKIIIHHVDFEVREIFGLNGKVFKSILGIDWCVSAKPVKRLELKKPKSFQNISIFSNRLQVTVTYKGLSRKALAKVKLFVSHLHPGFKDMVFDHVCEEGSNTINSEIKIIFDQPFSRITLNGEFSLSVSPANFFYYKFANDISFETSVTENSQSIINELTNDFSELFKKQDFADVDIKCGDEVFKAHKVILSSRSPVFAAMLQHEMKEKEENVIDIKDMDSSVLSILLEFIYCGKIDRLSIQTAGGLLSAAEQYQLAGLKKACLSFLQCAMTEDNVLLTLYLADLHDSDLKKISINFVCKEFDHLKNTEEWKEFQKDKPLLANEVLLTIIGFASEHGHKLC